LVSCQQAAGRVRPRLAGRADRPGSTWTAWRVKRASGSGCPSRRWPRAGGGASGRRRTA